MSGYRVVALPGVRKTLRKMEPSARTGIMRAMANLRGIPRPYGAEALKGNHGDYLRLRIGSYRIVYTVDDDEKLVTVFLAGHRKEIYRRLR